MDLFEEIKSYVGFSRADEERLSELRDPLAPHFEEVVAQFYDRLQEHPRARGVFKGPEQVERLRKSLHDWMEGVFGGQYDREYYQKRHRIGTAHVKVGLLPQFMFGAMNLVRQRFGAIILEKEASSVVEALGALEEGTEHALLGRAINSVNRILDIELTIMVQSYWNTLMKQKLEIPAALATGLAHEVRNPLNAIGLQMTLLERKLRQADVDSDVFQPVLEAVQTELQRIQGLNSEILDFAKPVEVERQPMDVEALIRELHRSHQLTMEAGDIEMRIDAAGDTTVNADRTRLSQVFVNLLTNAVEAMDEGGQIEVVIEGEREEGLVVEFRDEGQGMVPAQKYQIFDLFHTTKAGGTGIGLPIARKIVEAHEGSIDVMSQPGKGTTFTVYLPRD